ncbi:4a-hydroxytetrahydrobiopterin dehydratase [Hydrogenovibrio kuenenii]|uniref:4a-hydroxytetrahydrobiopterin dehydratase n=1 Tax=Hydrogenovibrio kuenenii TaxID=63658 RepID=UPI000466FD1C|nr:4a-hydroxytetrahydrobiopterin dehydratase [Hydrogenovibrio kuenenii]
MNERWKVKAKPASLDARFEFDNYDNLRSFLDVLADKADELEHHPNVSFGTQHVSVIIYSTSNELKEVDYALAKGMDEAYQRFANNS